MSAAPTPPPDDANPPTIDYESPAAATISKKSVYTLMLINFVDLMGFGLVILLLPYYAQRFDASPIEVAVLLTAYSACQFIGAPILGVLSDRLGRRPVLMFSQWGSVIGYLVLALPAFMNWSPAVGLGVVLLSRIIDGFTAGNITVTNAYVADVVPAKERAGMMGLLGAAFGLGFALGPPIGGLLSEVHAGLPGLLAASLSATASIMVWRFLPESHVNRGKTNASVFAFAPSRVRAVAGQPMVIALSSVWFLCMLAYVMLEPTVPLLLMDPAKYNWSEARAGVFYGFVGLVIILVQGGLVRPLNKRFGEWPLAFAGSVLGTIGLLLYAQVAHSDPMFAVLSFAAISNAFGRSLQTPTLSALVSQNSDPAAQGATYGVYQGMASLARVLGPLLGGWIYATHPATAFIVGAGFITLATVILLVIRPHLRTSHTLDPAAEPATA